MATQIVKTKVTTTKRVKKSDLEKQNKQNTGTKPCPRCKGTGRVKA